MDFARKSSQCKIFLTHLGNWETPTRSPKGILLMMTFFQLWQTMVPAKGRLSSMTERMFNEFCGGHTEINDSGEQFMPGNCCIRGSVFFSSRSIKVYVWVKYRHIQPIWFNHRKKYLFINHSAYIFLLDSFRTHPPGKLWFWKVISNISSISSRPVQSVSTREHPPFRMASKLMLETMIPNNSLCCGNIFLIKMFVVR